MNIWAEQMVMEDLCLTMKQITINVRSLYTILHNYLKIWKVSARWVLRMLTDENKASHITMCQAMSSCKNSMNWANFCSIVTIDGTWIPLFNPEAKRNPGSTSTHCHRTNFGLLPMLRKWWQPCFRTAKAWYSLTAFSQVLQWWTKRMKVCYKVLPKL